MFCIYCGNKMDENAEFCAACGNPVYREPAVETVSALEEEPACETVTELKASINHVKANMVERYRIVSGSETMLKRVPLQSPRGDYE